MGAILQYTASTLDALGNLAGLYEGTGEKVKARLEKLKTN